jgi:FixJ family two-component response regulator
MNHPRIMLVDDEPNIVRSLQRLFFEEEYQVFTANSGESALEILREEEVDLIISDYRMPGLTGTGFFKQAREIQPDAVRIILSGYAEVPALTAAINEGNIYQFIFKPWNDEDLKNTIRLALQQKTLTEENRVLNKELQIKNKQLYEHSQQLENIVGVQTSELDYHLRILQLSQELLEYLPIGVVGVSDNNLVVLTNEQARYIFPKSLGESVEPYLPPDLLAEYSRVASGQLLFTSCNAFFWENEYKVSIRRLFISEACRGVAIFLQEIPKEVDVESEEPLLEDAFMDL